MNKVSVILPIYNVGLYLDATFTSLMGQTLRDIEIIAVNDGSTDDSEEIVRKYMASDHRITLINQENRGQAAARNAGMAVATGEYIYFMDADDTIHPDALKTCHEYASGNNADMCVFDADTVYEEGACPISWDDRQSRFLEEGRAYTGEELLNIMMDNGRYNSVVWLYMVRRSFLKGTGISFYNGIIHEDELFSTSLFLKCRSVFCIRKVLVTHRIRTGSTMGTGFTRRNLDCYMTVADEIKKLNGGRTAERYLGFMLPIVFYTGHLIPLKDKLGLFARAVKSGYMGYIGLKSILVFWLKRAWWQ